MKGKINTFSVGLYRDDGLAVLKKSTGSRADRARKDLVKIFQNLGLKITVQTNLKVVDYLDVTLDLVTGSHRPFRKPNDTPLYVNRDSNHPPHIIKQIPIAVEKRISALSSTEEIFRNAAPMYDNALKASGYDKKIQYNEESKNRGGNSNGKRKNRGRKVTWFNPPYSSNVKTNVAGKFLNLVEKHFPKHHKLNKIFNKNTLKVSYSCMRNMDSLIKTHNKSVIEKQKPIDTSDPQCNCRKKNNCPLGGNCLAEAIVYKATIHHGDTEKAYFGLTSGPFKERYRNHTKSFNHEKYSKETQLSKYIWGLKKSGTNYELTWKIEKKSNLLMRRSGQCNLCMDEKLSIITSKDSLNKRTEILTRCRHRNNPRPPAKPPNRGTVPGNNGGHDHHRQL